ncbi:hypothetical protein [Achromobacter ruhlandii]|uniref:hypothetical protein n=1 Tax=Achromobacter ruhlandii TaxID=72557 RepID=UPI0007BF4A61|nr:hypothetical protein [Achromobacter ruhlandii]
MDYPSEFLSKDDIKAAERRQQWARDARKPSAPNATPDEIVSEMLVTGGRFAKQLALLWRAADPVNQLLIAATWPGMFAEYATAVHYRKMAVEADRASRN